MSVNRCLETGEYYHVFNKSIAGFKIFNEKKDFYRIKLVMRYYQLENLVYGFCKFIRIEQCHKVNEKMNSLFSKKEKWVEIVAYCLMPTHIHVVLKQLKDGGISTFMRLLLNSYTRYFNTKYKRKGPLWVGRFKGVHVETDEQLFHLTRYVHLNPTTSGLVDEPDQWEESSYLEYINAVDENNKICKWKDVIDMEAKDYKKFVEDQIEYQKDLGLIKHLMLESK